MAERINLEIYLDNGQLKVASKETTEALGKIDDGAKKSAGGFSSLANSATMVKSAVAGFMALQVVGFFKDVYSNALKSSGAMEKQTIALTTLLGSADKAKTLMSDITAFAAKTPFTMPGLINTSKQLLAFGIAQEDVIQTMERLGNAAMGNEEIMDRLGLAYGKIAAKGKASMEELNMLTEAGVPILKTLADQYGTSTDALFKMVEQGKVSFKDVDTALSTLTTNGGQFAGMIEKQSQSLDGLYSTLQDVFSIGMTSVGDDMAGSFKRLISALADSKVVLPGIIEMFRMIGKVISTFAGAIASAIEGVESVARVFSAKNRATEVDKLQKSIDQLGQRAKAFPKDAEKINGAINTLKKELLQAKIETEKFNAELNKSRPNNALSDLKSYTEQLDAIITGTKEATAWERNRVEKGIDQAKDRLAKIDEENKKRNETIALMQKQLAMLDNAGKPSGIKAPDMPGANTEAPGGGGKPDKTDAEKMAEEFEEKKQLLYDYNEYELQLSEFNTLNKQARDAQGLAYYEQVLRAKLGLDSRYAQGLATVTSTASTFMAQENIGLFRFGQALAIAKATQDTASGIMKTMAQWGWPLGLVGAAIVGTAGAINIADIAKQKPPAPPKQTVKVETPAFYTGGFVSGSSAGTLITAGERGKSEAVIPFENPEYMSRLRDALGINEPRTVVHVSGNVIDTQQLLDVVDNLQANRARDMGAKTYNVRSPY